ncbi:sarcosine oxidase subunit gamma [Rhodovibrionaceae bacterium A322]
MVEAFVRQSPLAHLGLASQALETRDEAHGVSMAEIAFQGIVNLRGDSQDKAFVAAVKKVTGLALPAKTNETASNTGHLLIALGPDEWWLVFDGKGTDMVASLKEAFGDLHSAVTDVSEYFTMIELAGPNARDVMAKGCTLDLHPRNWSAGQAAQTLFGKSDVVFLQKDDSPVYNLWVRRSFADYVWKWMASAAREYGCSIVKG